MKRGDLQILVFAAFLIILTSFSSAEIIILQQPNPLYSLDDTLSIPVTVKSTVPISKSLKMNLICSGVEENFYTNGITLGAGEEKIVEGSLVLTKEVIKDLRGSCTIKAFIESDIALSDEFKISDLINVTLKTTQTEFNPEEQIVIEGEAVKENGKPANGFLDLVFITDAGNSTENKTYLGTINNGFFSVSFSLPKETKAGQYNLKLNLYEMDSLGQTTNNGFEIYSISVRQIPTNLEIFLENNEVEPGTNLRVKAILHDQTGEQINSSAIISVKNGLNVIVEQTERATDEFLELPIAYNEPSKQWTVVAASNKITNQVNFKVIEKENASIEIANKTLYVTNTGNVPYNKTLLLKVGDSSLNVEVYLKVDESKKYLLSAPDGEYSVEVIKDGESELVSTVFLTGKAIGIKEASGILKMIDYPVVWGFIALLLAIVAFIVLKRGYKKSFFGYITSGRVKESVTAPLREHSLLKTKNRAELSLNLRGDKQPSIVICLKIKNLREMEKIEGGVEETLQEIIAFAEEHKASVYENGDYIFFMFVPMITKTFKNEKSALTLTKGITEILGKHNKMAKQKIHFGVSINSGDLVAKKDENLKFLSFGDLMTLAKRLSSLSDGEIHIAEKIREKFGGDVKAEKHKKEGIGFFLVKEIKEKTDSKAFANKFVKRLEKA